MYFCKRMHQECQFNLFCQYMLLLTKVKVFKLTKHKQELDGTPLAGISLLDMLIAALEAKSCTKIPIATTSNSNLSILKGKLTQIAKK